MTKLRRSVSILALMAIPTAGFAGSPPTASDMPTLIFELGAISVCNERGSVSKDDLDFFTTHIKADANRFDIAADVRDLNWTKGRADIAGVPPNPAFCQNYFWDLDSKYPHPDDRQPLKVEKSPLN